MRLTLSELKKKISKLIPKDVDYEVDLEAGSIAIVTKQPEAFSGSSGLMPICWPTKMRFTTRSLA